MSIGTEGFQVEVALGLLILQVWNVLSSLMLILYLALTYPLPGSDIYVVCLFILLLC